MSKFHSLSVQKKVQLTQDAVAVSFNIPPELIADYTYSHGQYITLELEFDGHKYRRAYSICTSPYEQKPLTIGVKQVENGLVSGFINRSLKVGDSISVMIPDGRFSTTLSKDNKKHYMLFAGGSGITPLLSILKSVLLVEPDSTCTLLYANRNKNSIMFKSDLDELKEMYKGRLDVVYSLDQADFFWFGLKGVLKPDSVKKHIQKNKKSGVDTEYFICGPSPMMQLIQSVLVEEGLPSDKIHVEYFTSPDQENRVKPEIKTATANGESLVTVILEGKSHEFKAPSKKTILAAAQDAGLDPPFSCEAGICSTCMAKVIEGQVKMIENNILTEREVEQGFVLTCQALCVSEKVKVEFYD
jgi:ring-1,2-phenylacetyl-CoA epoxidase subunit PaaE